MISFEEFKAEYKELIDLNFTLLADGVSTYQLFIQFDTTEDGGETKSKKDLAPENSYSISFPTTFNIFDSTVGFQITLKSSADEELFKARITVQEILLEPSFCMTRDLKNGVYFYIRFLVPENTYPMYHIVLGAKDLPLLTGLFGECDPFMRILKKNPNFGTYSMVYESEVHRNSSSPIFKPMKVSLQRLCGGDHHREIKAQMWDFSKRGGHYIVGEFKTNLNNLILLQRSNTPIKLLSADGTKSHGLGVVHELTPMMGPSFIRLIESGLKINLLTGVDVTGINPDSSDLQDRLQFVTNFTKDLTDRIGFLLNEGKLQFFGLNGKCCTDNLFTNYLMDMFPISGDTQKNSFNYKQIKGEFFSKIMRNFMFNTEGGTHLNVGNFVRFAVDHTEETRQVTPNCYSIAVVFLWHPPEDITKILEEFVNARDRPIVFWFVYLGQEDQERIQSLDGRKAYVVDEHRSIGVICKSMSVSVSYKTESHLAVRKLLIDTAQAFSFLAERYQKQEHLQHPTTMH